MAIFVMLIVWSTLIIGHELAHLLVARSFGFKTPIFGLGFPFGPSFKIKMGQEIELRIHPILFGGYVSIPELDAEGEHDGAVTLQSSKPVLLWQRVAVVLAGIVFYLYVSWLALFASVNLVGQPTVHIMVKSLSPTNKIASQAGIKTGDCITALDDTPISNIDDLVSYLHLHSGLPVTVHIERANAPLALSLKPNADGKTGLVIQPDGISEYRTVGKLQSFGVATKEFCSLVGAQVIEEDGRQTGIFISMLAFDLALINLIPFPGFDGGHLLAVVISTIRKKQFVGNWFTRTVYGVCLVFAMIIGLPLCLLRGRIKQ